MSQIDEIWILFLIIVVILIVVFVILRQAHGENYSGNVADVPKFKKHQIKKEPVQETTYQEIEVEEDPVTVAPASVSAAPSQKEKVSKSNTFDKDVTDPSVYLYRPQIRLPSKSAQQAGADPFRGDLHIKPVNRGGHFQSRYGSEGLRHDTMFNSTFAEEYNKLTSYSVVNEELVPSS